MMILSKGLPSFLSWPRMVPKMSSCGAEPPCGPSAAEGVAWPLSSRPGCSMLGSKVWSSRLGPGAPDLGLGTCSNVAVLEYVAGAGCYVVVHKLWSLTAQTPEGDVHCDAVKVSCKVGGAIWENFGLHIA